MAVKFPTGPAHQGKVGPYQKAVDEVQDYIRQLNFRATKAIESGQVIKLGEEEKKLGIRSSSTRQVFFEKTKVPVENLLGERNGGFKIAMNALNVGRIKLGAGNLDGQRRVISGAIDYANNRFQFKQPISNFDSIKEKIAMMAASCYAGESSCYRAASDVQSKIDEYLSNGFSKQESELKGVEKWHRKII